MERKRNGLVPVGDTCGVVSFGKMGYIYSHREVMR